MAKTVTKEFITNKIMDKIDLTKEEARIIVNEMFETLSSALVNGDRVEIRGFGVIEKFIRKSKKGYNFSTKQEVTIPARSSIRFKTSKTLDKRIN
jgi:nucleoid DNA-binding protein